MTLLSTWDKNVQPHMQTKRKKIDFKKDSHNTRGQMYLNT